MPRYIILIVDNAMFWLRIHGSRSWMSGSVLKISPGEHFPSSPVTCIFHDSPSLSACTTLRKPHSFPGLCFAGGKLGELALWLRWSMTVTGTRGSGHRHWSLRLLPGAPPSLRGEMLRQESPPYLHPRVYILEKNVSVLRSGGTVLLQQLKTMISRWRKVGAAALKSERK